MICPKCSASNPDSETSCATCGADLLAQAPTMATPPHPHKGLSDWQRHSRDSTILPAGFEIGSRYRVVAFLGRGGMGAVYRVHDAELNRDVALKFIRPELDDPNVMERFKREIALSSLITHRNVLRVYDLGENDGVKYLTMQCVEGEDLAALLRREKRIPVERAVAIFRQICEGLAAAHEQGVLHRDLKPANVMIGANDHVYLTDFGLARTAEQSGITTSGAVVGTPDYMSPEQVKGQDLDARSDIYSLGVVLFQLLTGDLPFHGRSTYEVMMERVQHEAPRLSAVTPQIPGRIGHVAERCLAMHRDRRYQSVQEILADLGGAPAPARRISRRSLIGAAAAAVFLVALGGVLWSMLFRSRETGNTAAHKPVSVLVADLDNKSGDEIFDETLEPILGIGLEGAPFVTTYNRAHARKAAGQVKPGATELDESLARLVGIREGVQVVVSSVLDRDKDSYRLTTRAIDTATGNELGRADDVAKDRESVLKVTGTIARKLRIILGDAPTEELAAETFTASSLEAAREYARGQELQWEGKYENAIARYAAAVKLDPTMGRAYAGMAAMYANLNEHEEAEKHYKLAMQHIDRMIDREKYRTRGGYYLLTRNHEKAIEEFRELIRLYPADTSALNNLALSYFYRRDMKRAMEEGAKPVGIYPKNVLFRNNHALYSMYAGDFDSAGAEAGKVLEINPQFVKGYVALAISQAGSDRIEQAQTTYDKLHAISARGAWFANVGRADLSLLRGDHTRASEILRPAIAAEEKAGNKEGAAHLRTMLAEALVLAGQNGEAAREASLAAAASSSENVLYAAGRALIAAGVFKPAREISVRLASMIETEAQLYAKLLEGEALLAEQKPREAVNVLSEAQRIGDSWTGRYLRGKAYTDLGAFTEAYSDLEAASKRKGEAVAVLLDDVPTVRLLPYLDYELGRAQHGLGSPAARASFEKFLRARPGAENDPLVADARKRLGSR